MAKKKSKTLRKKSSPKKTNKKFKKFQSPKWSAVPLKGSFMVTAILGFLLSYYYLYNPTNPGFGIASMIVFALMFIASLVSMAKAPLVTKSK